jgi:hypothetical protein
LHALARRGALLAAAAGAASLASPWRPAPPGREGAVSAAAAAPAPSPAASAQAPAPPPRLSLRARVASVGGRPPDPGRATSFAWQRPGGGAVKAQGAQPSPWLDMTPAQVERFLARDRNLLKRGLPLVAPLSVQPVTQPTRLAFEARFEGQPGSFSFEAELYGPRATVAVAREGARWVAETTAAYNRRYWPDFAAAALPEADRPRHFPFGDTFVELSDDVTAFREASAALRSVGVNALNLTLSPASRAALAGTGARLSLAVYAPPGGPFDYKGGAAGADLDAWAEAQFKPYREAGFAPGDVALFGIGDEPAWYYPTVFDELAQSPGGLGRFRAYLRAQGLTPAQLGAPSWAAVAPLGRAGVRDDATRRRFYWTARFFSFDSARHFAEATRALERAIRPGVPTYVNWNNFGGSLYNAGSWADNNPQRNSPDAGMGGHDWFEFARQRGSTYLWTEGWFGDDYAWRWPFYFGKLLSAAEHAGLQAGGMLTPRVTGKRRRDVFEQQALALVGSGAKAAALFAFGPEYNFPGNCYSEVAGRVADVAAALRLIARAEDVLWPGRRPPPAVALVTPRSSRLWDPPGPLDFTNTNQNGHHPHYAAEVADLFLALQHANVPVDFVDEDELTAAGLARYKAVYLTEPAVPEEGLKALGAWVRGGGTLVTVLGAGTADRYDRPTAALSSVTGVEQDDPSAARLVLPRGGAGRPTGRVRAAGPEGPLVGPSKRLRRHRGEALARFDDGAPAIVRREVGGGRHVHFDFFPGISYLFSTGAKVDELPVALSEAMRRWIVDPALAAGVEPPVRTDVDLVDAPLLLSPTGAAITLLNWTGGPVDDLTVRASLPFVPRAVRSVRRGPVPFEVAPGGVVVHLPLADGSDVLAIYP